MSRTHVLASLLLTLGVVDLAALNLWLVPAAWPPLPELDGALPVLQNKPVVGDGAGIGSVPSDSAGEDRKPQVPAGDAMAKVGSSEAAALSVAATSQLPVEDDQERETAEPAVSPVEPVGVNERLAVAAGLEPAEEELRSQLEVKIATPLPAAQTPAGVASAVTVASGPAQDEPEYRTIHETVIRFGLNEETLPTSARDALLEVVRLYREHPGAEILADGHTDRSGRKDYNQRLSERRAGTVAAALEAEGVPAGVIQVRGYGSSRPLDARKGRAAKAANRRVEITIRSKLP